MASCSQSQSSPVSSEDPLSQHVTPATRISNSSSTSKLQPADSTKPSTALGDARLEPPKFALPARAILLKDELEVAQKHPNGIDTETDPFLSYKALPNPDIPRQDADVLKPVHSLSSSKAGLPMFTVKRSQGETSVHGSHNAQGRLGVISAPFQATRSWERPSVRWEDDLLNLASSSHRHELLPPMESVNFGHFSAPEALLRLLVVHVGRKSSMPEVEKRFSRSVLKSLQWIEDCDLLERGIVYLSFADSRDADRVFVIVDSCRLPWTVKRLQRHDPFPISRRFDCLPSAQILIRASCQYTATRSQLDLTCQKIQAELQRFGPLQGFAMVSLLSSELRLQAEFYDCHHAGNALMSMSRARLADFEVSCDPGSSQRWTLWPSKSAQREDERVDTYLDFDCLRVSSNDVVLASSHNHNEIRQASLVSEKFPSFTTRKEAEHRHIPTPLQKVVSPADFIPSDTRVGYSWPFVPGLYAQSSSVLPFQSSYRPSPIGQERGTPQYRSPISSSFVEHPQHDLRSAHRSPQDSASGHHNFVSLERIRRGEDVRTTIMLRNIPNKIDQAMLKDIVDETSLGKYDFMYLRIDFANNCNVGYAFINFDDPFAIIDFVKAKAGQRWNRYNSDKVAEVSYATIQGRDCLIQKFRNSSVMLESPSFRPKLFHTFGPLIGQEERFPMPDNPSKMRRSVENAEHVGLFAPRAGQTFRDDQRRRRSQYDRGTRLAEIEDSLESQNGYSIGPCSLAAESKPLLSYGTTHTANSHVDHF